MTKTVPGIVSPSICSWSKLSVPLHSLQWICWSLVSPTFYCEILTMQCARCSQPPPPHFPELNRLVPAAQPLKFEKTIDIYHYFLMLLSWLCLMHCFYLKEYTTLSVKLVFHFLAGWLYCIPSLVVDAFLLWCCLAISRFQY